MIQNIWDKKKSVLGTFDLQIYEGNILKHFLRKLAVQLLQYQLSSEERKIKSLGNNRHKPNVALPPCGLKMKLLLPRLEEGLCFILSL